MSSLIPQVGQIGLRLAISRQYRNRYRQVIRTLLKHGFGVLVDQLGLSRYLPFRIIPFRHREVVEVHTQAERLRMVFEELGTTFIKFGQILSTRVDLLPSEYIYELGKLLDQVPPAKVDLIKAEIERELNRSVSEIFTYFDPEPLASASIGQVHAAKLKTGESVVVKVKRPGVQGQVAIDVEIITDLARLASSRLPSAKNYDFEGIAREFTQTLLRELDYIQEGRNADRFRENFEGDERVYIPYVYWDFTSSGVITMERISGLRINDKKALGEAGIDPKIIAKRSADILLEQVFRHGFFHADPHPANFFVMADGVIGIVDFGMAGYIDQETKANLVELFIAIFQQDADAVIDAYVDLGVVGRIERIGALRSDIRTLIMKYYGLTLRQVNVRDVLNDVVSLVRRYSLRLPADLALLIKTVSMEESLVLQLDSNINFAEAMAPFARRVWEESRSPLTIINRGLKALTEYSDVASRAPRQIRRILNQLSRGELTVVMQQPRLDEELQRVNLMVNRLILGILTAAILTSVSMLLPFLNDILKRRRERKVS